MGGPLSPHKREKVLQDCLVLALYFGGEWCPHCITFKPTVDRAYGGLQKAHGAGFEVVYISSDQDETAFKRYFGAMGWYAVPFDNKEAKQALDQKYEVSGIPTVILLRRDENLGGAFVLVEGGMNGRAMIGQPPSKLVAEFPWGGAGGARSVLQLETDLRLTSATSSRTSRWSSCASTSCPTRSGARRSTR